MIETKKRGRKKKDTSNDYQLAMELQRQDYKQSRPKRATKTEENNANYVESEEEEEVKKKPVKKVQKIQKTQKIQKVPKKKRLIQVEPAAVVQPYNSVEFIGNLSSFFAYYKLFISIFSFIFRKIAATNYPQVAMVNEKTEFLLKQDAVPASPKKKQKATLGEDNVNVERSRLLRPPPLESSVPKEAENEPEIPFRQLISETKEIKDTPTWKETMVEEMNHPKEMEMNIVPYNVIDNFRKSEGKKIEEDEEEWRTYEDKFDKGHYINCDLRYFNLSQFKGLFDVVLVDPPWKLRGGQLISERTMFNNCTFALPYNTLTNEEIIDMDVGALSKKGFLFLWTIKSQMEFAFACMNAWGYNYVDMITWVKTTNKGNIGKTNPHSSQKSQSPLFLALYLGLPVTITMEQLLQVTLSLPHPK